MRIGFFGGSFDPPHRGHLAVACAARDRFALDRVLLAPTGRQPLKPGGPAASFADRLRMVELLCQGQPRLEASAIDAPHPDGTPNYTVDTLRRLHAELAVPRAAIASGTSLQQAALTPEIFAIVGADAFQYLPKWRDPAQLLELAQWIVVSRPEHPLPDLEKMDLDPAQRRRIYLLPDLAEPASATKLRSLLQQHNLPSAWLPAALRRYINAKHLYRGSDAPVAFDRS